MATIILTPQMILDYAEKNPKANATDILKHFNSLKDKYVNRNGVPLKRLSIQNILSKNFDLTPTVPKGYQKASELFMSSVDDNRKNRIPILKGGYFKTSYLPNADGTKGSQFTRLIDRLLKPKILGSGRGGNTLYLKTPTKEEFKLIYKASTGFDRLKPDTVNRMKDFHNLYKEDYKRGNLPDWNRVSKDFPKLTRSQAGLTFARLAQWYKGQPFKNEELRGFARLPKTGEKMLKAASNASFGNLYNQGLNEISLATIDEKLGRESGTFKSFKDRARNILKKNNIPLYDVKKTNPYGFNINEIVGTSARARSKAVEFSQFIDVMEGKLNQTTLARYQTDLGIATDAIEKSPKLFEKNPKLFKEIAFKMNKKSRGLESDYGIRLAKIRPPSSVDKYYSPNRLKQLRDQGININTASKRAGYTFEMPRGAMTVKEFGDKFSKDPSKLLEQFTAAVRGAGKCQTIIKNAFMASGGRVPYAGGQDACARAVEANPEAAAKIINQIPEQSGPINKVKNAATRFLQGFKTSGSLRGKVALGAGAVIGGGGAAALVREFRSDDKSTYLTNDRQMEGMIIADDIERDLEDMGFILDNEGKIELAATGALSASMVKQVYNAARAGEAQLLEMPKELDQEARALRKTIKQILYKDGRKVKRITESGQQVIRESRDRLNQIENLAKDTKLRGTTGDLVNPGRSGRLMSALGLSKGVLGLGLNAFMSPAIALPTAAMSVARDIKSGKSTEDTLTNPFTYLPTAFMKSGMKGLAKMGATRGLMGIAGLGLGSVAAAPVVGALSIAGGLATLGSMGYQGYKMFKDRNKTDEDFFN